MSHLPSTCTQLTISLPFTYGYARVWQHNHSKNQASNHFARSKQTFDKIFRTIYWHWAMKSHTKRAIGAWPLTVCWWNNYIPKHAVLLQSKIVLASTSSFVQTCYNPEPTSLALGGGGRDMVTAQMLQIIIVNISGEGGGGFYYNTVAHPWLSPGVPHNPVPLSTPQPATNTMWLIFRSSTYSEWIPPV